jgi:hypothetical protein
LSISASAIGGGSAVVSLDYAVVLDVGDAMLVELIANFGF